MKKDEDVKVLQEKYLRLQMLDRQMKQVQQQVQALDAQVVELDGVQCALDEFKMLGKRDAFVGLTPGIFARAKITGTDSVLISVGGGVVVEKDVGAAKKSLAGQADEMRQLRQELSLQLEKLGGEAQKVEGELQKLVK